MSPSKLRVDIGISAFSPSRRSRAVFQNNKSGKPRGPGDRISLIGAFLAIARAVTRRVLGTQRLLVILDEFDLRVP